MSVVVISIDDTTARYILAFVMFFVVMWLAFKLTEDKDEELRP